MSTPPVKPGAAAYAATRDWPAYFDAVAGKPARETLVDALKRFEDEGLPADALAVDLGCGEGRDTVELLRRGWRVHAIDAEQEAFDRLHARPDLTHVERLKVVISPFELIELPRAHLVNASFALPFCPPAHFDALWSKVMAAIPAGGRFAGQLFVERDTWAALPDRSHQTRAQVERLLAPFVLEHLSEEEREGEDASGFAKHWHIFHVVARKMARSDANKGARANNDARAGDDVRTGTDARADAP
jgi:SAM-dependent methyltransferase